MIFFVLGVQTSIYGRTGRKLSLWSERETCGGWRFLVRPRVKPPSGGNVRTKHDPHGQSL
jgi:hypothetical protein